MGVVIQVVDHPLIHAELTRLRDRHCPARSSASGCGALPR